MLTVAMAAAAFVFPAGSGAEPTGSQAQAHWEPTPTSAAWQWQLQGRIDTSVPAAVYDVDGFEVSKGAVLQLHRLGRRVVCYLDVGSWETYRPDAGQFPKSVIGRRYEGFPDERWLDIRRFRLFAKPLEHRFDLCARKGFDAVEPDNLAGWENHTGFPIARQDQLRFNRWVARQVHARGMAVALKNDGGQAPELVDDFDFAIVEQCFQYEECGPYRTFVEGQKAVFEAEYEIPPEQFCPEANRIGFSAIGKSYDLFAQPWRTCQPKASTSSQPRTHHASEQSGARWGGPVRIRLAAILIPMIEALGDVGVEADAFLSMGESAFPCRCWSRAALPPLRELVRPTVADTDGRRRR